jgi:DUF438 domain-containing protein
MTQFNWYQITDEDDLIGYVQFTEEEKNKFVDKHKDEVKIEQVEAPPAGLRLIVLPKDLSVGLWFDE